MARCFEGIIWHRQPQLQVTKGTASPTRPPATAQHQGGHRLRGNTSSEIRVTFWLIAPQFDPLPKHWTGHKNPVQAAAWDGHGDLGT